ncbi:MAG: hypothetical protein Q9205_005811 [Flavoplaca limonia]
MSKGKTPTGTQPAAEDASLGLSSKKHGLTNWKAYWRKMKAAQKTHGMDKMVSCNSTSECTRGNASKETLATHTPWFASSDPDAS